MWSFVLGDKKGQKKSANREFKYAARKHVYKTKEKPYTHKKEKSSNHAVSLKTMQERFQVPHRQLPDQKP